MYKRLFVASIFVTVLAQQPGYAISEAEQIRLDCKDQVMAYGLTEAADKKVALEDCIDSMTPAAPVEQDQDQGLSDEVG